MPSFHPRSLRVTYPDTVCLHTAAWGAHALSFKETTWCRSQPLMHQPWQLSLHASKHGDYSMSGVTLSNLHWTKNLATACKSVLISKNPVTEETPAVTIEKSHRNRSKAGQARRHDDDAYYSPREASQTYGTRVYKQA